MVFRNPHDSALLSESVKRRKFPKDCFVLSAVHKHVRVRYAVARFLKLSVL